MIFIGCSFLNELATKETVLGEGMGKLALITNIR